VKRLEVIPAIDIMKGKVVKLVRGDPRTAKAYDYLGDPVTVARSWESQGAKRLHIVDLDASLNKERNLDVILEIADAVNIPLQVGGGIRELQFAEHLLEKHINRIVLGTLAFDETESLVKLRQRFGADRIMVALDLLNGEVMVDGWRASTRLRLEEAMSKLLDLQVEMFLVTSISRDGTLEGPDIDTLTKACGHNGAKIIAAGGVGDLDDLIELKRIGVFGVVVGRALYEGAFTLRDALNIVGRD
jgi:phosphoribosylformimino-5-aminoimidazole carboxamide ribotide isomerase